MSAAYATISQQGGRTSFFLFFDSRGKFLKAMENSAKDLPGASGRNAADFLADEKVTFFVAGEIGPKMKESLKKNNIACDEKSGYADEVMRGIIQNQSVLSG